MGIGERGLEVEDQAEECRSLAEIQVAALPPKRLQEAESQRFPATSVFRNRTAAAAERKVLAGADSVISINRRACRSVILVASSRSLASTGWMVATGRESLMIRTSSPFRARSMRRPRLRRASEMDAVIIRLL